MSSQVAGAANGGGTPSNNPDEMAAAAFELPFATPDGGTVFSSCDESVKRNAGGGAALTKSAANQECLFFFEDEVFKIDSKGRVRFGVVTETSESFSSDEDDDIDDALCRGEVRVAFYPDGKEIVHTEQSIGLADRTLMPGDVVRRRLPGQKDLTGQAGYVRDVSMRADVKVLGTKYVIKNVPSERLRQISEWARDVPVCFGTWIGTTLTVDESAVLKSVNNARLEITSNDFHKFKDAYGPCVREVFNPNVYYPGNVIVGRLPPWDRVKNLTPDIALPPNRKGRSVYTVESVKTTAITVAWTCKGISQCDKGSDMDPTKQPKSCIKGDDLANVKRLNLYESYMLQIHDRFYLKYSKCDTLVKYAEWEDEQGILYLSIYKRQQSEEPKAIAHGGLEPSPSNASSSRSSRFIAKFRRLGNKSSGQRLNRSQAEAETLSLRRGSSTNISATKSHAKNDETWDSVDDEDDDDETQEPPDAPDATEVTSSTTEAAGTATASNANSAQTPRNTTRHVKRRHVKKKMRSIKKSLTTPFTKKDADPKDGDEMVVETLVVYSAVTVVWQDGNVESGIPSTELYPIHHLDNHEFFPGDFVSKSNDNLPMQTDYGVIQSVDHDERIAKVKWFNIYGNMGNPIPSCKDVEELSVYDLRDHSDYQYRPGTMVIRVSNFTGEDLNSTAGQVIDNFPDGRVRVWWAKGHITMCYPQDLFEINHSEDQEQDAYASDGSEDSWETQSENSRIGINIIISSLDNEELLIAGIDSAKNAMKRLEKIFRVLPSQRKSDVLNDLLSIYKNCRFLDHLLQTNFFHEDHFQGILRRKLNWDSQNCSTGSEKEAIIETEATAAPVNSEATVAPVNSEATAGPVNAINNSAHSTSTPTKRKSSTDMDEVQCKKSNDLHSDPADAEEEKEEHMDEEKEEDGQLPTNIVLSASEAQLTYDQLIVKYRNEYADMLSTARLSIAKAFEKRKHNKNDSGVWSRGENSSSDLTCTCDSKDPLNVDEKDTLKSVSNTSIELVANRDADVCEIFYFLINEQMAKCRDVILETFCKSKEKATNTEETDADADAGASDVEEALEATELQQEPTESSEAAKESEEVAVETALGQSLNLNTLSESLPALDSPIACSSPSPLHLERSLSPIGERCFDVLPNAPSAHHFIGSIVHPTNKSLYQRAVQREYRILQASLPHGVFVRSYEDRMDLMSVMMVGPMRTPYQNALFFFDIQMGREYPKSPPSCHYTSYCTERLNPNLYEEGRVCVSLLGTWAGRDTEVWTPESTMLQVLVSIQGLILVEEPYYNEAGYDKQRGTQLGNENSRVYNEMAIIKIAHSTVKQLKNPPLVFRKEMLEHFKEFGNELHNRMLAWSDFSSEAQRLKMATVQEMPEEYKAQHDLPEFPLLPCSRGFCIALKGVLKTLKSELDVLTGQAESSTTAALQLAPRAAPEVV